MKKWFCLPLQEKLKYLTFSAGAVVFLSIAANMLVAFFGLGGFGSILKDNSQSLAFWTSMDEESAAFDRFIQEQTKETRQEWEKSAKHTELMLNGFGANVQTEVHSDGSATASILPCEELYGQKILVPGDISSAAYFIAAGLLTPGSEILLKNVGINPTRDGMLRVCKAMGADITLLNASTEGEPTADLLIRTSSLHGTTVEGEIIPTLIDEIPMIAVMAAFAEGTTVIRDAQELKVKESDRIAVVTEGLKRMGADIQPTDDGMIIHGGKPLHGAEINSYLDHRIAMSFAVAGTICDGTLTIKDGDCVKISYPEFYEDLYFLGK